MPGFNIDAYRANFQGGARSYLFYFKPLFPAEVNGDTEKSTYLVRTTSLPETSIDEIPLSWQGFDFKVAGKYTYSDWTVTFNCDANANILGTFHDWAKLIHDPTDNKATLPSVYMKDQQLELLNLQGEPITKYKLFGVWPKVIGNSSLDYSQNDVVQFDITFSYLYHTMDKANYAVPSTLA